ncbi:ICOS ligand-like isoform X2 [Vanacampus margaritifer]
MRGPLWSSGLLLGFVFFTSCTTWDEECVLGIVGQPLRLSCFYPDALTLANVSVEWRRNEDKVMRDDDDDDDDALRTGNFTLRLSAVEPQEDNASYSVIVTSSGNRNLEACTLCVRVAAPFSPPELQWEVAEQDIHSVFQCDSGGGFPEPLVYWLIDGGAQETPEGSVETQVERRPDSRLYHVTSFLTVNVTDANVSCVIHNALINQTLTSTTHAVWYGPVVTRATDSLWLFSTALCAVVGVMVAVGLGYQIHLDRVSKRKKIQHLSIRRNRGYHRRRQETEDTEVVTLESESNV